MNPKHFVPRLILGLLFIAGAALGLISCTETPEPIRAVTAPPTTPTPPPDNHIQVWLTLADASKKLNQEPELTWQTGTSHDTATIDVDGTTLYQQMEGFGAAMTDSSAWLIMNKLEEAQRQQLMNDLFTREGNGIGLSYLRLPMGASDFAQENYSYDDLPPGETDPDLAHFSIGYDEAYIIPALQMALALNPQLRFMGSPWSAPAWMKENGSMNGEALLPEFYQAFANYHVQFVQAYAAANLPIDAITPQNEPMHSTDSYPSMAMSARSQQTFIRDYLGPAFREAGLTTRILILDHNWDLWQYPLQVLADPAAAAYIDGVAFHCYGGDVANQTQIYRAYPDKGIWFTECSGGRWATDFGDNVSWNMHNLVLGNFRNWGKSLLLWNLALDEHAGPQNGGCGECRGVVTINQNTGELTYNEEFYILGHVSKFVDPGAYRINSTWDAAAVPDNVAFLNPDGSMVLLVHADTATTFTVTWNGQQFSYSLPAKGTATFKWASNLNPGPTVTPDPAVVASPTPLPASAQLPGTVPTSTLLLDFATPDGIFARSNAEAIIGTIAHTGNGSLQSHSAGGNWHVVGANFVPTLDLSGYARLCFAVYDATEGDASGNTIGLRLTDSLGGTEERWTDHDGVGTNPRTSRDEWVQMCFNLSAFSEVDLTRLMAIEFNSYWAGDTYFDSVIVEE